MTTTNTDEKRAIRNKRDMALYHKKMESKEFQIKMREKNTAYRNAHLDKRRQQQNAYSQRWRAANPDKVKADRLKQRDWRRDYWYRTRYGMSTEQVESLAAKQLWLCAICSCALENGRGGFAVDHSHVTGAVRGILCYLCNTALGALKDNLESCRALVRYLEKS